MCKIHEFWLKGDSIGYAANGLDFSTQLVRAFNRTNEPCLLLAKKTAHPRGCFFKQQNQRIRY
jgi:hypothetical protein